MVNGVSWVAPPQPVDISSMKPVLEVNANWVCIMPFAFSRTNESFVKFDNARQWWGERSDGAAATIGFAKKLGLKTLLKPQVWFSGGAFTGNYDAGSEEAWQEYEAQYRQYIITMARVAEEHQVEMFAVGTEYGTFAKTRPDFWRKLIKEVRSIYKGKLTYAANWDTYKYIPFWDQLDVMGIDAYFPISDDKDPSMASMLLGWQKWANEIELEQKKHKLPVIFTEFGCRTTDYALKEPWSSDKGGAVNLDVQGRAYQAMFKVMDEYDWFKGGFVWKWFHRHNDVGGLENNRFTPQNKPGEKILSEIYGTRKNQY